MHHLGNVQKVGSMRVELGVRKEYLPMVAPYPGEIFIHPLLGKNC